MIIRLACIALILWPACASAQGFRSQSERQDAKRVERTRNEARAVLGAVLRDAKIEMAPCLFDDRWSTRPVRAEIARGYLGSSLDADVIASDMGVTPHDLINPTDGTRGSFCSEDHAAALWRQMRDDFRSGANPGELTDPADGSTGMRRVRLRRVDLTMPVFDRAFSSAAVVAGYTSQTRIRSGRPEASRSLPRFDEAGNYLREIVEGFGYTYVYRKRGGRWVRIYETEDWALN